MTGKTAEEVLWMRVDDLLELADHRDLTIDERDEKEALELVLGMLSYALRGPDQ